MFKIVKKAIDEFNPYSLLPDSPYDEFDSESREIERRIKINSTVEEIAEIISEVFSKAFNEKFERKNSMVTVKKIYKSIKLDSNVY